MTVRRQDILFDLGGHCLTRYGTFVKRIHPADRGGESLRETVTRADAATCATFRNRAGIVRTAAAGILRPHWVDLDADTVLESPGFLSESSRTNLALRSDAFDHAAWTKNDVTVVANQSNGPADEGAEVTMDRIVEAATTAPHGLQQGPTLADNTVYVYSVCGKTWVGRSWIALRSLSKANVLQTTWFNIASGAIGTQEHSHANFERLANDSFRCWVRQDAGSGATTPLFQVNVADADGSISYAGDTNNGVYLWGAQVEAGFYPSMPIKTDGSAVTRAADRITLPRTFGALDSLTIHVRLTRPVWADITGVIGARGIIQISTSSPSLSLHGEASNRNWEATVSSGNTQNANVAIPSGQELVVTAQYYDLLTAPKCKVAPNSGVFGTPSAAASAPLSAFGNATIDVGNLVNSDRFDGTILRILAVRGQHDAPAMAAVP